MSESFIEYLILNYMTLWNVVTTNIENISIQIIIFTYYLAI